MKLGTRRSPSTARELGDVSSQVIPRLGAGSPHFRLRLEPARVIKATGPDANEIFARGGRRKKRRPAFATKGAVSGVSTVGSARVALRLAAE